MQIFCSHVDLKYGFLIHYSLNAVTHLHPGTRERSDNAHLTLHFLMCCFVLIGVMHYNPVLISHRIFLLVFNVYIYVKDDVKCECKKKKKMHYREIFF